MEKLLEKLELILKSECDLHEELLGTANLFNDAIKKNDLAAIQKFTTQHDEQVYQIAKLEEQRIECATNLARELSLSVETPKMAAVLEKVPPEWHQRLSTVQSKLKEQISELTRINTSNRILLEESLHFINSNIVMFQKSSIRNNNYGDNGKHANISAGRNLINRVV